MVHDELSPKALWRKACKFDDIPIDSDYKSVVFSKHNPYVKPWQDAVNAEVIQVTTI